MEKVGLIRRIPQLTRRGQTSNSFEFLWHEWLASAVKKSAPEGVKDSAPKENQIEENHSEETESDLDFRRANRKKRDSRPDVVADAPACRQYPLLREALADYMTSPEDRSRVFPPDRLVVDVMLEAGAATEQEVVECLAFLRNERGLRPDTRNGPRYWSWFKTVVGDHFHQKKVRESVYAHPEVDWDLRHGASATPQEELDAMTAVLEIEEEHP